MYREHTPISLLRERVDCVWEHRRSDPHEGSAAQIVPDGCVDILWNGQALRVAGPDTRPVVETFSAGSSVVGLRFRTGRANTVLGTPLAALCDQRIDLRLLWADHADRLVDQLAGSDASRSLCILQQAVLDRRAHWQPIDPLVSVLTAQLHAGERMPELRVSALAQELGLSERQLLRRCTDAIGYGPKLLARILRMQRVRTALWREPRQSLAALAAELGFADQAHLAHDSAQLFGKAPGVLRAEALAASGALAREGKTPARAGQADTQ